jgi:hypothetical protein
MIYDVLKYCNMLGHIQKSDVLCTNDTMEFQFDGQFVQDSIQL